MATDGVAAHGYLLGFAPLQYAGACWHYVWQAYKKAGASTGMGSTPTAYKGWLATSGKRPGDRNPPPGAAIWLGRRLSDGNMDGDVFIAGANDRNAATDYPGWKQTGIVSIQARINQTGREYLGWSDHVLDVPIILGGGGGLSGSQRQVVAHATANGRADASTQAATVGDPLQPNTVGNFDAWKNGEAVEGNPVWFRGTSGRWFWSGGFTDKGTHDLADLNPAPPATGNQRTAVAAGANGRAAENTGAALVATMGPGEVGTFDGWKNGESIEGNPVWFRRSDGPWFWSSGFTDRGTHDLADLNPPTPTPSTVRTVGANSSNIRSAPTTGAAITGSEASGAEVQMQAWAEGESVENNAVWYQRTDGGWHWSGGFTSISIDGLPEVDPTPKPEPEPPSKLNPRGLPEYPPVYPRAVIGLEAPLGFTNCEKPVIRASRKTKGDPPVPTTGVLDRFIVHWTGVLPDQTDWFSHCNARSVAPTIYINALAQALEFIRPGVKPATTGPEWNWRSWAVEIQRLPGAVPISDAQINELIEQIIFLAEHDGGTLDGAPVSFKIDREHIITHREALPGTECPGDYLQSMMNAIVAEAKRRYDQRHPTPEPEPETVEVPIATLQAWQQAAWDLYESIGDLLEGRVADDR